MTEELLAILVCPVTRTKLRWDEAAQELVSEAAGLAYPVRDGIPVMLVEEARKLDPPRDGEELRSASPAAAAAIPRFRRAPRP